ncbi:hypothetical protein UPYG_G00190620 [Umbra pygmaea]|uniref:Uncharacterized protein n=1 Tax=Umbra pygmaea TaxID=75934 RepID=A0ABD0WSQ9_UMBPY
MGAPPMGGPRYPGPRIGGPRPPQRAPEPSGFGGFMSMFGVPTAPSKPVASGSFFSSPQSSFFGSSTAPPPGRQPQQKGSFFGLPTNLPTESLTTDIFGIFNKETEPPKQAETVPQELTRLSEKEVSETADVKACFDPESDTKSGEANVMTEGPLTEATQTSKPIEEIHFYPDEVLSHEEPGLITEEPSYSGADKACTHPAEETKGLFDIPGRAPSALSFVSGAANGASSLASFFGSTPSTPPAIGSTPQPEGGLFSGFKGLSAGIFHEEKTDGKEEPLSASSVFGKKLSFPWHIGSEPPKTQSPPLGATAQLRVQGSSPSHADDGLGETEADKHSLDSDSTEGADPSDTDEPTDNSGTTGSMDKSPGSYETLAFQSEIPSDAMFLVENLDKTQSHITPPEEGKGNPSTDPRAAEPVDTPLTKDAIKSPVDSCRFGSSGNLSQVSSQLSSDPEVPHSAGPRAPLHRPQPASWEEEEEEDGHTIVSKSGSSKDLKQSIFTPPILLANHGSKKQISLLEHGSPPCSPVKVRWLKVINKVRVQLLEKHVRLIWP